MNWNYEMLICYHIKISNASIKILNVKYQMLHVNNYYHIKISDADINILNVKYHFC
jgi:hypothetical protein